MTEGSNPSPSAVKKIFHSFFNWYEKHHRLNLGIAAGLFLLQLIHLYWLTSHVLFQKLFGVSLFNPSPEISFVLALVDYTEIPAIVTASLVYINELRKAFKWAAIRNLLFLNSQWIHLFWITDEFILTQFAQSVIVFPFWLAILAILIDYLELPVMYDVVKRFLKSMKSKKQINRA